MPTQEQEDYYAGYISIGRDTITATGLPRDDVDHMRSVYLASLSHHRWQSMREMLHDQQLRVEAEHLVVLPSGQKCHWMVQLRYYNEEQCRYLIVETSAPLSVTLVQQPAFEWDVKGNVVWLNNACQKLTGIHEEQVAVDEVRQDLGLMEEVKAFVESASAYYETSFPLRQSLFSLKLEVVRRDVEGKASVVRGLLDDITSIKHVTEEHRKLKQILERLPIPLYELNSKLELLWCNQAHESICCKSFEELRGYGWAQLFNYTEDIIKERIDQFRETFTKGSYATIDPYPQPDGSVKYGKGAISFQVVGHQQTFIGYMTDVTDLVNREEMLKKTNVKLQSAIEASHQAQKARTLFFASVSHEIRSPLNGILGNAHLLMEQDLTLYQRESCQVILDCSNHLLQLVSDILELSKIQSEIDTQGNLTIKHNAFDLVKFAVQVLGMFRVKARNKQLNLVLELFSSGQPVNLQQECLLVRTDEARVRQVIINLLSNAIKFSEKGTVTLRIEVTRRNLNIVISDQGVGIKDEDVRNLFEPFIQANSHININYEGFGLGLSICDRLVKALGGTITLQSVINQGSTFKIDLPIEQVTTPPQSILTIDSPPVSPIRPIKILVCDDNAVNRMVLVRMLKSQEHACDREVVNGQEALDALLQEHFDLAFMDISLPDFSGIEVIKKYLSRNTHMSKTWMIACTANCMSGDEQSYIEAGFDAFLGKPFGPRQLKQMIQVYLESLE